MKLSVNQLLVQEASVARNNAYAPYSNYKVGAALLDSEENVYTGCNVENAAYGSTLCAERGAIMKAISVGSQVFSKIAIVADTSKAAPWPCGSCRQMLDEFSPHIELIIADASGRIIDETKKLSDIHLYGFSLGSDARG
ncbi:cytidine deaminase [Chlamydiales bacterium]|nr:cytidine deaminase [Chlamydiales bacterium]